MKNKKEDDPANVKEDDQPRKRRKRYQHEVLDSGWGCGKTIEKVDYNLPGLVPCTPKPQRVGLN